MQTPAGQFAGTTGASATSLVPLRSGMTETDFFNVEGLLFPVANSTTFLPSVGPNLKSDDSTKKSNKRRERHPVREGGGSLYP